MKKYKIILGFIVANLFCYNIVAQVGKINVVTTAVPFLGITPDSRSAGMGNIGIATSADENAGFHNIAKSVFAKNKASIGASYSPWLTRLGINDVYFSSLNGFYKVDENNALTASLRYFNLGDMQFTDALGNSLQSYRPRETGIDIGYTRRLGSKNSVGIALRYINSNLANGTLNGITYSKGTAVATDVHYFHNGANKAGNGLSYGVTLTNLGNKISYTSSAKNNDFIPANLGLGMAYTTAFNEENKITFGLEVHKLMVPTPPTATGNVANDSMALVKYRSYGVVNSWFKSFGDAPDGFSEELQELNIRLGAEYNYNNQFFLRAGYFYENQNKGSRKFVTLGTGIKLNNFGLQIAYIAPSGKGININPLSNTVRFSMSFDINE